MIKLIELTSKELDLVSGGRSYYTSRSYNTEVELANIGNNNGNNNQFTVGNGNGITVTL